MKNINFIKIFLLMTVIVMNSGFGYVGDLPKLGESSKPVESTSTSQPQKETFKELDVTSKKELDTPPLPIAPRNYPSVYTNSIISQGKYTQYLKDLNDLVPILESMRKLIENIDEKKVQLFCAKTNTINLHVKKIERKYNNKAESYYESYKQLKSMNKNLNETAEYWKKAIKYRKILRGSAEAKATDQYLINTKLSRALNNINTTLDVINESTTSE